MSDNIKNFMHYMWYREEDGIITIGINEQGLEDITEITSIDLPPEQEEIDAESPIGTLDSDDGSLDICSPVKGTVVEVNTEVLDNPEIILEDPYEEGWLLRIESAEDLDDEEEDEDEDDLDEEDEDEEFEDED